MSIQPINIAPLQNAFAQLGQSNSLLAQRREEERRRKEAKRIANMQTLGTLAGAVIGGATGGPGGAMLGSSIGSQAGAIAGGGEPNAQQMINTGIQAYGMYDQMQQRELQQAKEQKALQSNAKLNSMAVNNRIQQLEQVKYTPAPLEGPVATDYVGAGPTTQPLTPQQSQYNEQVNQNIAQLKKFNNADLSTLDPNAVAAITGKIGAKFTTPRGEIITQGGKTFIKQANGKIEFVKDPNVLRTISIEEANKRYSQYAPAVESGRILLQEDQHGQAYIKNIPQDKSKGKGNVRPATEEELKKFNLPSDASVKINTDTGEPEILHIPKDSKKPSSIKILSTAELGQKNKNFLKDKSSVYYTQDGVLKKMKIEEDERWEIISGAELREVAANGGGVLETSTGRKIPLALGSKTRTDGIPESSVWKVNSKTGDIKQVYLKPEEKDVEYTEKNGNLLSITTNPNTGAKTAKVIAKATANHKYLSEEEKIEKGYPKKSVVQRDQVTNEDNVLYMPTDAKKTSKFSFLDYYRKAKLAGGEMKTNEEIEETAVREIERDILFGNLDEETHEDAEKFLDMRRETKTAKRTIKHLFEVEGESLENIKETIEAEEEGKFNKPELYQYIKELEETSMKKTSWWE